MGCHCRVYSLHLAMLGFGFFGYYLWVAPHVLQGVLLIVLWRRRLFRHYPMFAAYTLAEIFQFALLLYVSRLDPQLTRSYLHLYLLGMAFSTAFRFGIIAEILGDLFRDYPVVVQPAKWVLRGAAGLLILAAVALAAREPGNLPDSLQALTYGVDRAASILQSGLLLALLIFARYLTLSWRSHSFGIAIGLGVFSTAELAVSAARLYVTPPSPHFFDLITMAVYHCCVLVWIGYLLMPEPAPGASSGQLPEHNLQAWSEELERMLQP